MSGRRILSIGGRAALTLAVAAAFACVPTRPPATPGPLMRHVAVVAVSESGAGLEGAAVQISVQPDLALHGTTNRDGYVPFELALPADILVRVSLAGHLEYEAPYRAHSGQNIRVTLRQRPPPVASIPAPPAVLRGQFVIETRNPFAGRFPRAHPNRFFMAELDSVWKEDKAEAQRILDAYKALGFNHVPAGTPVDHGYSGHYPDADWRGDIEGYADFLQWLRQNGVVYTLFLVPDYAPYFLGIHDGFGFDAIERDLTPIFLNPRIQALTLRTATIWEQWAPIAQMGAVFDYQRRIFPNAERCWHNGVGHLSPGGSDESEEGAWRSAAAHGITGFCYQATPPTWQADREPIEQLKYDLWDMARRFGIGPGVNPWGLPIRGPNGQLLTIDFFEGTAYSSYWDGLFSTGPTWGKAALSVPGIRFALDGSVTP